MGLFNKLFSKKNETVKVDGYFKTLSAYTPVFTTYEGGVYEMELTRAAIHAFATHCSKLKPEIQGSAYKSLANTLAFQPNPYMDTTKFLYRLATILSVNNTAFIIPIYDSKYEESVVGFYPILPIQSEVVDVRGEPWLRYTFENGERACIEVSKVGILTQFQFKKDFFGEDNGALDPTMKLLDTQNQGIIEGVKASANIRFMARLANIYKSDDIEKERIRFTEENLGAKNNSGVMMFDNKYADVKQIDSKPFIIDAEQVKAIQNNVFNYFGVNEDILQNKFDEDKWNSYYEGKIEPFAIQLSLVMTNMLYTSKEKAMGNNIMFTANRLQYASNTTKLNIVTQLFDRGFLTHNQGLEIFNMAGIEDGDKHFIRKEYAEISKLDADIEPNEPKEPQIEEVEPGDKQGQEL